MIGDPQQWLTETKMDRIAGVVVMYSMVSSEAEVDLGELVGMKNGRWNPYQNYT